MTDFLTNDPRFYAARKTDQSGGRGWDLRPDIGAASDRAETRGAFIRAFAILGGVATVVAVALTLYGPAIAAVWVL